MHHTSLRCEPHWPFMIEPRFDFNLPWIIRGDFDIIRNTIEKIEGSPPQLSLMEEFNNTIIQVGLEEPPHLGNLFS